MYRKSMILMATLALVPASAHAQSAQAEANAAAHAATPEARIEAAMQAAAEAQLPISLLESKVQESRAKGVAAEQMAATVEARLEGLLRAREALARAGVSAATEGELLVASEALRLGVSEAALIAVNSSAPGDRRAVATAVLTDLVRLGIEPGQASVRVNAALQAGSDALANLRAETASGLSARGQAVTRAEIGRPGGH